MEYKDENVPVHNSTSRKRTSDVRLEEKAPLRKIPLCDDTYHSPLLCTIGRPLTAMSVDKTDLECVPQEQPVTSDVEGGYLQPTTSSNTTDKPSKSTTMQHGRPRIIRDIFAEYEKYVLEWNATHPLQMEEPKPTETNLSMQR